ncbi:hypothetical protein JI750_04125 [Flavobacterium sp. GN10]|uniref:Natural product n=1 Tax=Flavobacterium tagetis TaxID=2801336 RepID=A0ABS1K992_9FLAO|nr:hypothetical protein [Flavobacterium tagetis]MBL0736059.1 hypothetical protein [Flavobacterium tagetis]
MKNLEKISLVTVEGKLSRTEMKNIMAGSAVQCCIGTTCGDCRFWDLSQGLPVCSNGGILRACV